MSFRTLIVLCTSSCIIHLEFSLFDALNSTDMTESKKYVFSFLKTETGGWLLFLARSALLLKEWNVLEFSNE